MDHDGSRRGRRQFAGFPRDGAICRAMRRSRTRALESSYALVRRLHPAARRLPGHDHRRARAAHTGEFELVLDDLRVRVAIPSRAGALSASSIGPARSRGALDDEAGMDSGVLGARYLEAQAVHRMAMSERSAMHPRYANPAQPAGAAWRSTGCSSVDRISRIAAPRS
jgi:hypothetical protein